MEKDRVKLKPNSKRRNSNERMQWWRLASLVLLAVVSVLSGYQSYSQKPTSADSYEKMIVREDRPAVENLLVLDSESGTGRSEDLLQTV